LEDIMADTKEENVIFDFCWGNTYGLFSEGYHVMIKDSNDLYLTWSVDLKYGEVKFDNAKLEEFMKDLKALRIDNWNGKTFSKSDFDKGDTWKLEINNIALKLECKGANDYPPEWKTFLDYLHMKWSVPSSTRELPEEERQAVLKKKEEKNRAEEKQEQKNRQNQDRQNQERQGRDKPGAVRDNRKNNGGSKDVKENKNEKKNNNIKQKNAKENRERQSKEGHQGSSGSNNGNNNNNGQTGEKKQAGKNKDQKGSKDRKKFYYHKKRKEHNSGSEAN